MRMFFSQTDPNGAIPDFVKKKVMTNQPELIIRAAEILSVEATKLTDASGTAPVVTSEGEQCGVVSIMYLVSFCHKNHYDHLYELLYFIIDITTKISTFSSIA